MTRRFSSKQDTNSIWFIFFLFAVHQELSRFLFLHACFTNLAVHFGVPSTCARFSERASELIVEQFCFLFIRWSLFIFPMNVWWKLEDFLTLLKYFSFLEKFRTDKVFLSYVFWSSLTFYLIIVHSPCLFMELGNSLPCSLQSFHQIRGCRFYPVLYGPAVVCFS